MNKFSSLIIRLLCPDPVLFWAYMLPVLYWIYLTLTTNFVLVFDSEGYYGLAHLFYNGHWVEYFRTGPNREPLYPLIVAASMVTGKWLGISYTYTLKIFSFGFLIATMMVVQQALKMIKTSRWIVAATILYIGFSPILVNSALCLYSEIATFPWLVAAVLFSIYYLRFLVDAGSKDFIPAIGLSLCLLGFTFVKGIGEGLGPLFLIWLFWHAWRRCGLKLLPFLRQSKFKILLPLLIFYAPLLSFKSLNYAFNGHFNLTNRGDIALGGTLIQRTQSPLTMENFLTHLSTVTVSYGSPCTHFFSVEKCYYWSKSPDDYFREFKQQFDQQNISLPPSKRMTISNSMVGLLMSHPFRQIFYTLSEGLKMFFWQTSQGAFVVYPVWLEKIFNTPNVVVFMSLVTGGFCVLGFLTALALLRNELILVTVVLTGLLILLYSLDNIIHRYAIGAAPLIVLLNASCLSVLAAKLKMRFKQRN